MNREDIIRMAREAGFGGGGFVMPTHSGHITHELEAFAALVASAEREACAKLVEDSWMAFSRASNVRLEITPFPELSYVAKVIRARGQA